jgi:predicted component of type VI protein secretion system
MDSPPFALSGARWRAVQSGLVDVESNRSRARLRDKLVRPFSLGAPLRLPVNLGTVIALWTPSAYPSAGGTAATFP